MRLKIHVLKYLAEVISKLPAVEVTTILTTEAVVHLKPFIYLFYLKCSDSFNLLNTIKKKEM